MGSLRRENERSLFQVARRLEMGRHVVAAVLMAPAPGAVDRTGSVMVARGGPRYEDLPALLHGLAEQIQARIDAGAGLGGEEVDR